MRNDEDTPDFLVCVSLVACFSRVYKPTNLTQFTWCTGVAQRLRAGPSPRRAARLRAAGGAADTAHRRAGGRPLLDGMPPTAQVDSVCNRQRAAATEAGAQV